MYGKCRVLSEGSSVVFVRGELYGTQKLQNVQ